MSSGKDFNWSLEGLETEAEKITELQGRFSAASARSEDPQVREIAAEVELILRIAGFIARTEAGLDVITPSDPARYIISKLNQALRKYGLEVVYRD